MAPNDIFCFVTLTLKNPPMENEEIIGHMSHRWFSPMHILVFRVPSPFLQGAKMAILGKIFDKVLNWQLTIPQVGGIWEIENISVND